MTATEPISITTKTQLLGVAGWPVEHSLSPQIQNAALRAARLDCVYLAFAIAPDDFETAVRGMAAAGMVGLNCTVPHKQAALAISDELSVEARLVGAVNTLHFRRIPGESGMRIVGSNTDVEGFVESLRQDGGFDFAGRTVVQIGAGGAGRGMALGALQARAGRLVLVNRTVEKARALARELLEICGERTEIEALSPEADAARVRWALGRADLVANATSLGLGEGDAFPCAPQHLAPGALVFDAAYTAERSTAWLRAAAARGCRTLDGLGMLVRQGAASLRIWTGLEADLNAMFNALPGGRRA